MINVRMLREKIGALETQNMRLVHKLKELLSAKGDIRRAINLINDHCKQNDCSIVINNKNNLIKEIKYNKIFEYPDYLKEKQNGFKNLSVKINTKVPHDLTLDDANKFVGNITKNVGSNASVSWEIEPTFKELSKMGHKKLLSLGAQGKLGNNLDGSPFKDIFDDFFGDDLKEKLILKKYIKELEGEIKKLKNAKTNKKRKRRSKKTK